MMNTGGSQMNLLPTKLTRSSSAPSQINPGGLEWNPNATPRWTSQPVLSWVESLAAATEGREMEQGETRESIVVNNVALSRPADTSYSHFWELGGPAMNPMEAARSSMVTSSHPGDRRRSLPYAMPKFWDLRFLSRDQNPENACYIRKIATLAVQVESLPPATMEMLRQNYQAIQHQLGTLFRRIMEQPSYDSMEERCLSLDSLYNKTIVKLNEILENAATLKQHGKDDPSSSLSAGPPKVKKDLSKFMTAWLRENWTNPYPDEDGLEEMAQECGTTATVVSNWLINARTRKWRPAIVKASDLNRPAQFLLRDSLSIFEGQPLLPETYKDEDMGDDEFMLDIEGEEEEDEDEEGRNRKRFKREEV